MNNKVIETDFNRLTILDDQIVLAVAKQGVEVTVDKVERERVEIENVINGDYAMILDRKNDYSIAPVEVYTAMSHWPRLKALAIVAYRDRTRMIAESEKRLFSGPLEVFGSVDDAHAWLRDVMAGAGDSLPTDSR